MKWKTQVALIYSYDIQMPQKYVVVDVESLL